jgi:hypothetical protein
MASEAQIIANRGNAEKSTGPRTEEGKAVASQNAVKHGLMARRDVIGSEDPAEFDRHRELMLAELDPSGPIEHILAERIVSLSWRLKRAERMQNEALDCLLAEEGGGLEGESDELGSFVQTDPDVALGRAVVKDFAGDRALERLMVYERRIEHSLYKAMSELHRMKLLRPFDDDHRARPPEPLGHESTFRGDPLWSPLVGQARGPSPTSFTPCPPCGTPRGATTSGPSFKTNPIPAISGAGPESPPAHLMDSLHRH